MKLIGLLTALLHVLSRVFEVYGERKRKEQRSEYERKIEAIDADPIDYANGKFRVQPDPSKATGKDLPGDTASDPANRE